MKYSINKDGERERYIGSYTSYVVSLCRNTDYSSLHETWLIYNMKHFLVELLPEKPY